MSEHQHAMRLSIEDHFAGRITARAERDLRAHLPECERCRHYYERMAVLARFDPKGLDAQTRLAVGLGLRRRRRLQRTPPMALAAAAAAGCLLVWLASLLIATPRFAPRGRSPEKTCRVHVYRLRAGQPAALVDAEITSTDRLAFAYENRTFRRRLAIFGVDEHAHVYWFHPAWSHAAQNPSTVEILSGNGLHELPAAIEHDFDGRRLRIYGVFTDEQLTVREVEAELKRSGDRPAFAGAEMAVLDLRVQPGAAGGR